MSRRPQITAALLSGALALGVAALSLAQPAVTAQAHEFKSGDLLIGHPFARASIPQRPGVAYARIENTGSEDDRLVAVSSPVAARVELHTHIMENGIAKMRRIEAIEVPAGGTAELKPGNHHIMLFDLPAPLKEGDEFPLVLTFKKAGDVEVVVKVEAMGSGGMSHGEGMSHGDGMKHGTDDMKTSN